MVTENALLKLDIADIFTVEKNLNIITSYDVAIPKLKKMLLYHKWTPPLAVF